MGALAAAGESELRTRTRAFLLDAMPRGEYVGWVAEADGRIVAGAGVQVRRVLPFPAHAGHAAIAEGRQAIVINVYTEPAHRRRGLARQLMEAVIAWSRAERIESLVLHAAPDGKHLYESLGFVPTNEMRLGS